LNKIRFSLALLYQSATYIYIIIHRFLCHTIFDPYFTDLFEFSYPLILSATELSRFCFHDVYMMCSECGLDL